MAKKIGDLAIGVLVLTFLLGTFIAFFISADSSIGINTNVSSKLSETNTTETHYNTYLSNYYDQVDNTTTFETPENIYLDKRGTSEAGLTREENEETLTSFMSIIGTNLKLDPRIVALILGFITITSITLFFRSLLGDSRW